MNNLFGF